LTELTSKGVLPTASEGVRVLDVGTGPGPAAIAIEDYYSLLTEFGGVSEARNFIGQSAAVSVIEQSEEMLRFLRHFCEFASRPAPNEAPSDFSTLDVVTDRVNYHHRLRSAEWYEPATDDYFPEYSAADANTVAQRLHRYRLIVFSNFFTEEKSVLEFRNVILKLFKDLRNGGTVTVLSASGRQYKSIHETIASLAASSRLKPMREVSSSLGAGSYFRVAGIIKNFQHKVYLHLLSLSGPDSLERGKSWPDYWNPEPYQGRRSEFGLRVYRKGKWPGNTK
jgi:SAM-dependent methyltransferase